MELAEILPQEATFEAGGQTFTLRNVNLSDRVWINERWTPVQLAKLFEEVKWGELCKIIYRLIVEKDKLQAVEVAETNDEGLPVKYIKTGPMRLLEMIPDDDKGFKIIGALNRAIANSNPLLGKYVEDETKKKMMEMSSQQTGQQSLTSSLPSTDGQPTT